VIFVRLKKSPLGSPAGFGVFICIRYWGHPASIAAI